MVEVRAIRRNLSVAAFALVVLMALAAPSHADLYGFKCITNNDPDGGDGAIGEAQISMDVSASVSDGSQVSFFFANTALQRSSITDVYFYDFDDGTLAHFDPPAIITSSDGVDFDPGATPPNLPSVPKTWKGARVFSADSSSPTEQNGVNSGQEWLSIAFNLETGYTFDGVINDLATGTLVVGVKVQGFADGCSESFVNEGPVPPVPPAVPLPGALLLGGMGLGAAGCRLRTRKEPL